MFFLLQIRIQIHRVPAALPAKKAIFFFLPRFTTCGRFEEWISKNVGKAGYIKPDWLADAICLVIYVSPAHETLATMN